jgi:hypothetical protein
VDYRPLNAVTIKNMYPLPCIDILFDQLAELMCSPRLIFAPAITKLRFMPKIYPRRLSR